MALDQPQERRRVGRAVPGTGEKRARARANSGRVLVNLGRAEPTGDSRGRFCDPPRVRALRHGSTPPVSAYITKLRTDDANRTPKRNGADEAGQPATCPAGSRGLSAHPGEDDQPSRVVVGGGKEPRVEARDLGEVLAFKPLQPAVVLAPESGMHVVQKVWVHHNIVTISAGQSTGAVEDTQDPGIFTRNGNRFEANTYYLHCLTEPHFFWADTDLNWSQWQALGKGEYPNRAEFLGAEVRGVAPSDQ